MKKPHLVIAGIRKAHAFGKMYPKTAGVGVSAKIYIPKKIFVVARQT